MRMNSDSMNEPLTHLLKQLELSGQTLRPMLIAAYHIFVYMLMLR